MKQNTLQITGKDTIVLATPKGSMAGFRWDGEKLIHSTGKTMKFNADVSQQIEDATINSHLPLIEKKYGYEIKDGDREGWKFVGVENDAHGIYIRQIEEQKTIVVNFSKEDLA